MKTRHACSSIIAILLLSASAPLTGCWGSKASGTIEPVDAPTPAEARRQRERAMRDAIRLVERGDDAFSEGDIAEALDRYAEAAQTDDSLAAAWNNLGVALMAADRYAEAADAFLIAQRANPQDPRPAYNRGLLNYNRGYIREARDHFDASLDAEPNYLPALWGAIKADRALAEENRETLDLIRRALRLEPDDRFEETLQRMRIEIEDKLELGDG